MDGEWVRASVIVCTVTLLIMRSVNRGLMKTIYVATILGLDMCTIVQR